MTLLDNLWIFCKTKRLVVDPQLLNRDKTNYETCSNKNGKFKQKKNLLL